jgi:hypothetical protein
MRTSIITAAVVFSAASTFLATPARADYVQQANQPPVNTPSPYPAPRTERAVPLAPEHPVGLEAQGGVGSGFQGTYAFGIEARVGYTWPIQLYVGGNVQYYFGTTNNQGETAYALFVGPEVGYKFWAAEDQLEIRPNAFVGLGFNRQTFNGGTDVHNTIAIQPGALALWHFKGSALGPVSQFYAGADAHFFIYPPPAGFGLLAVGGGNF